MFSGCLSVKAFVRACVCPSVHLCVRACVLLARYLTNQRPEFHQTLVDDIVEATNELIRF